MPVLIKSRKQMDEHRLVDCNFHNITNCYLVNNLPLYSMPHLSLTMTGFPVSEARNGLGLTTAALD